MWTVMASERLLHSDVDELLGRLRQGMAEGRLGIEPLSAWTARIAALGSEGFGVLIDRMLTVNPAWPAGLERILIDAAATL